MKTIIPLIAVGFVLMLSLAACAGASRAPVFENRAVMSQATALATNVPAATLTKGPPATAQPTSTGGAAQEPTSSTTAVATIVSAPPVNSITIEAPTADASICSPVNVSGRVTLTPFEATLRGRVLDTKGRVLGEGPIHVNAEAGKPGTFSGQIKFDTNVQGFGRVEVADISPKDGSVLSSAHVEVKFACG